MQRLVVGHEAYAAIREAAGLKDAKLATLRDVLGPAIVGAIVRETMRGFRTDVVLDPNCVTPRLEASTR